MKPKVLIIDDDPDICQGIKEFLDFHDYVPRIALSGEDAFKLLEKEEMDIILLDYMMPIMNGLEFLEKLRQEDKTTPVVMVTAKGSMETVIQANRLGLADCITKPVDHKQLREALKKAADHKRTAHQAQMFNHMSEFQARFPGFVGKSLAIRNLVDLVKKMADRQATILILGETGTGKELVSRLLHDLSERKEQPFVSINCATFNANLLESELFGHERGAFTGANERKHGLFQVANGGTLFLDEIGEMSIELQAKLLRVLENGEFRRVGGTKMLSSDIRVITATNRDLRKMVQEKLFREDLYYRLNTLTLNTPPLRSRTEDIPDLTSYFLGQFGAKERELTPACRDALKNYSWPGNVRELRNTIERMVILGNKTIGLEDLPPHILSESNQNASNELSFGDISLARMESLHIEGVLKRHKGNKAKSSRILGITKMTLYKKIQEYQLVDYYPKERSS